MKVVRSFESQPTRQKNVSDSPLQNNHDGKPTKFN
jgi:hypothetical protein